MILCSCTSESVQDSVSALITDSTELTDQATEMQTTEDQSTDSQTVDSQATYEQSTQDQTTASQSTTETAVSMSESTAKAIALADAGVSESDVVAFYISRDWENGREVFDVEFYANNIEYDYKIAVSDGTIVGKDWDAEFNFFGDTDSSSESNTDTTSTTMISSDEAAAIALAYVSGATTSNIVSLHYEIDDGRGIYEGTIIYNDREYEFEIDATTATVINWEEEWVWD